ncbi:hypothetical protein KUA11_14725 [Acetobacter estunensis]|nr:hypothetical protein [Acetobacter estunensis]
MDEFTSKSGREIASWTPENVYARLKVIYLQFGDSITRGLVFGMLLYRHASEIAHGTLYGILYSWGAMEINRSPNTPDDIAMFRRLELRHILRLISYSLESFVRIFSVKFDQHDLGMAAKSARILYYKYR